MIYILLTIVLLAAWGYFLFTKRPKPVTNKYFESTQTESKQRIEALGLGKQANDPGLILDVQRLSFPKATDDLNEEREYKGDSSRDWIIDLVAADGSVFQKADLLKTFDYEWRSQYPSQIYGLPVNEHRWTYAFAGDAPEQYSKIHIAIDLQEVYENADQDYDPSLLERYITELTKRISNYPIPLSIKPVYTLETAISNGKQLIEFHNELDGDAIVVLKADTQFNGEKMWHCLQDAGLTWGDGDLFHWSNYGSDYGDDQFFSVWTTTEPGYFFPEHIKSGQKHYSDLVFGFSIPRNADPINVFAIMLETVHYCQFHLGGKILDRYLAPIDEQKAKADVAASVDRLIQRGIVPGSEKALITF